MAVRARVLCIAFIAALVTPLEMPAEGCGSAAFDGTQHTLLPHGQRAGMCPAKLVAMGAHNVGDFQWGPHKPDAALLLRIKDGVREQIQWAGGGADGAGSQAKVACRRGKAAVTQQKLDLAEVGSGFEEMNGIGVS